MERVRGSPGPDQGSLVMFSVMFQGSSLILSIVVISWSFMLTIIQTPNTREQQNKLFHLGCWKKMNSSTRINIGLFFMIQNRNHLVRYLGFFSCPKISRNLKVSRRVDSASHIICRFQMLIGILI